MAPLLDPDYAGFIVVGAGQAAAALSCPGFQCLGDDFGDVADIA
jgi:hypothetical protein